MTLQEQVEAMVPKVRAKAERYAEEAIGSRFSIRVDKRTVQYGNICKCEVAWVGQRGMAVVALWKVWLENGGLHFGPYTVKTIPVGGAR